MSHATCFVIYVCGHYLTQYDVQIISGEILLVVNKNCSLVDLSEIY